MVSRIIHIKPSVEKMVAESKVIQAAIDNVEKRFTDLDSRL
jgi:hypothetical protein